MLAVQCQTLFLTCLWAFFAFYTNIHVGFACPWAFKDRGTQSYMFAPGDSRVGEALFCERSCKISTCVDVLTASCTPRTCSNKLWHQTFKKIQALHTVNSCAIASPHTVSYHVAFCKPWHSHPRLCNQKSFIWVCIYFCRKKIITVCNVASALIWLSLVVLCY